jgi:hypothetical protein
LAIVTTLTAENYLNDCINIVKEFISTYISSTELEITYEQPFLQEDTVLTIPILFIEDMIGLNKPTGIGKVISQTQKGEYRDINLMFWWIFNDELGGMNKCREFASKLDNYIMTNGYEISQAGIRNSKITSFKPVKVEGAKFYGGRQILTGRILLTY